MMTPLKPTLPLLLSLSFLLIATANTAFEDSHAVAGSSHRLRIRQAPPNIFYVQLNVGNPPLPLSLQLDTVSPLTWLQPEECQVCFPLSTPPFDPFHSTTYSGLPSTSPICSSPFAFPTSDGSCAYDAGYTEGYLGIDTFSIHPRIAFGLGFKNNVVFDDTHLVAGVFGLGRGHPASITSQMRQTYFSWCLPESNLSEAATLELGGEAASSLINKTTALGFRSTPLTMEDAGHNYINLTLIRVDGDVVYIGEDVSPSTRPKATYAVLDAAFPYTMLATEAFNGLQGGVIGYFNRSHSGMQPIEKPKSGYDLCFTLPTKHNDDIVFPPVEVEFLHGAVLQLKNSFVTVEEEVCMTIRLLGPEGPNIVGSDHQVGTRFLMDYAHSILSFAPDMC